MIALCGSSNTDPPMSSICNALGLLQNTNPAFVTLNSNRLEEQLKLKDVY